MRKVAILGAGSWGLTLAWLMGSKPFEVCLWDRKPEKIEQFRQNRNINFPVEMTIPEPVRLTSSLPEAIHGADAIILVVTTAGTRETARAMKASGELDRESILINASKGIEFPSLMRIYDVVAEELPENPLAVLSGPTLAKEILSGLPTCCSIATPDIEQAEFLQVNLSCDNRFRLYSNTDVIGVELGGALKNIFAIASGYMQAKRLGENARSALITRGLAEMTRFSVALGAQEQTLYGMSGLGDLLATCNSPLSRNYQVGYQIGQGKPLEQILTELRVVAEGVQTTHAVSRLSEQVGVDTPIVKQIEMSLTGKISEEDIIRSLMSRKLKSE